MEINYFETFLHAVETCPDRWGILGEEELVFPPSPDYGYESTPQNALTFGAMGVDGVHFAVLKIEGVVRDNSPVIQISPMDFSKPYLVLGDSFLIFLADACGASIREMQKVFLEERTGKDTLVPLLKQRFDYRRLFNEKRLRKLDGHLDLVEQKR